GQDRKMSPGRGQSLLQEGVEGEGRRGGLRIVVDLEAVVEAGGPDDRLQIRREAAELEVSPSLPEEGRPRGEEPDRPVVQVKDAGEVEHDVLLPGAGQADDLVAQGRDRVLVELAFR